MTIMKRSALTTILLGTLGVSACATHSPNIADIQYNPGRYYNRNVQIDGVVSSSWGVPLVPFKIYKVQDSTGRVRVTHDGARAALAALPRLGHRLGRRTGVHALAIAVGSRAATRRAGGSDRTRGGVRHIRRQVDWPPHSRESSASARQGLIDPSARSLS